MLEQLQVSETRITWLNVPVDRYSVYLLFWYKGTQFTCVTGTKVLSLFASLVQQYKY
jgi:hypothetical protein